MRCIVCDAASREGVCLFHEASYELAWVVGIREGVLQRAIGGYKFLNMKAVASDLAELLDVRLPSLSPETIVLPVPTAPAHIRERGYDHMLLIAKQFCRLRNLSLRQVLGRGDTATQHHATRRQRQEQAKRAFRLVEPIDPTVPYLILDDVVTTGSTIEEAARILKNAGAMTILVGALARQPLD